MKSSRRKNCNNPTAANDIEKMEDSEKKTKTLLRPFYKPFRFILVDSLLAVSFYWCDHCMNVCFSFFLPHALFTFALCSHMCWPMYTDISFFFALEHSCLFEICFTSTYSSIRSIRSIRCKHAYRFRVVWVAVCVFSLLYDQFCFSRR